MPDWIRARSVGIYARGPALIPRASYDHYVINLELKHFPIQVNSEAVLMSYLLISAILRARISLQVSFCGHIIDGP